MECLLTKTVTDYDLLFISDILITYLAQRQITLFSRAWCWKNSKIAFAFRCTAVALSERRLEKVELIVEWQLLVFFNVLYCEYPNAYFSKYNLTLCCPINWSYVPLLSLTVWITWVINEPRYVSNEGRVNDLVVCSPHQICAGRCLVLVNSLLAQLGVDWEDLAHVLHDECAFGNELSGEKAPALVLGLCWKHPRILVELEPTVLAERTARTCLHEALCWHTAINAPLTAVERLKRVGFLVLFRICSLTIAYQKLVSFFFA